MTGDPFGTRALRDTVLAAWSASPARFREDANAEEDHAHGYYRDRVVVELAQNAADAAVRAGSRSTLLLSLTTGPEGTGTLLAANTGAPLDAAGVASLASLRASAKRAAGTVGRFGVG
uniref:sacsin N-terminal ATP-binding-like domain-containing protein n=1 Tax=Actinotalea sp. C106 TaxID=2908644 RepID=UPI0035AB7349